MTIAIPSHLRSSIAPTHAIRFAIEDLEVNPAEIYVFVSDDQQMPDYAESLKGTGVNIINAKTKNVRDKFNYVHLYFKDSRDVLVIEDDVKGLTGLGNLNPKEIVKKGFDTMHKQGKSLWGIYPSSNKYFMKPTVRWGFNYIVANMYGFTADGDKRLLIKEHSKTDYERSILYAIYKGGSVRLDYVAAKTNNYTTKGGMQVMDNRAELESTAAANLVKRFPKYVTPKRGTKSKYAEIKLIKK